MNAIRLIDPGELRDQNLKAVADRISDTLVFAGQRSLACIAEPLTFPQPSNPLSLERIFVDYFRSLPEAEVGAAARRSIERLRRNPLTAISPENTPVFGRVELGAAEDIEAQLARLSPAFRSMTVAVQGPGESASPPVRTLSGGLPGTGGSQLRWRLRRLDCNEETGLTAAGSDRVFIGGVAVDAFGNSTKVPVQDLGGGWDTGNHVSWPDRTLTGFDLDYGTGWPRPCTLVLAISVRSAEGLWNLLDRIVEKAKDEVIKYAAAAAGAAVGGYVGGAVGSLGGPLGTVAGAVVGAVVGYVIGYVIDKFWSWLKSQFTGTKLFKPVPLSLEVPFHGADFGGSLTTGSFKPWWTGHHGKYTATVDAVLRWGPARIPSAISVKTAAGDRLDLFGVDGKNRIQGRSWGKHSDWKWTAWSEVQSGKTTADAPIAIVDRKKVGFPLSKNLLDLFTVGMDGRVWTAAQEADAPQDQWKGWWPVLEEKFILGTGVSGISRNNACLDIFITGKDWKVRTAAWGPQTEHRWRGWWTVGQGSFLPGTPVAATSRSKDILDLFAIGLDGRVWSASWGEHTQGKWNGWFPIRSHIFLPGRPITALCRKKDQIDLFAVDVNGEVRTAAWSPTSNSGNWGGWWRVTETNGKFAPGTPVAAASRGEDHLDLFAVGLDGRVWSAAWGPQTNHKWAGWWPIGEPTFAQGSMIAATARGKNQLDIFINGLDAKIWSAAWDGKWKWFAI